MEGRVRPWRAATGNRNGVLEVETRAGIPPARRDHIFQRFYRILDSRNGGGLGRSDRARIALQHDANHISYNPHSSDPELPGSLFRVSLHLLKTAKTISIDRRPGPDIMLLPVLPAIGNAGD